MLKLKDGSEYSGSFREGICTGYGVLVLPDDTRYEGRFDNGKVTVLPLTRPALTTAACLHSLPAPLSRPPRP